MTRKFIIDCHPAKQSLCFGIYQQYVKGAEQAGHQVKTMRLSEMLFDADLANYQDGDELEPSLIEFQQKLNWSEHAVFIFPLWWGFIPAKMKGLIDRSFLPDYAYKYDGESALPKKLLGGRSAEILVTSDTPNWVFNFIYRAGAFKILAMQIFGFVGFKPVKFHMFSQVRGSTDLTRKKWLVEAVRFGKK